MSTKATGVSRMVNRTIKESLKRRSGAEPVVGTKPMSGTNVSGRKRHDAKRGMNKALVEAINKSARYLVTYDARIIATFAREEDAFLLESELADLDREHKARAGKCEVIDRRTGSRLGGYLLTGGRMLVFVRDEEHEVRFGKGRR